MRTIMYKPFAGRISGYKYYFEEILVALLMYKRMGKRRLHGYGGRDRRKILNLVRNIRQESELLLNASEAYTLYSCVKNTAKVEGDIAEVGVYRGGSAKIICEAKGERPLHLFDTFEGIPAVSQSHDGDTFAQGQYAATLEGVTNYLTGYGGVSCYKGIFPETADAVRNCKFSFVNLDVDVYESTLHSLEFFYPRMSRGGIILSHDYCESVPGVKKAVDEFFSDKPEVIVEVPGFQCLIVKV
jgi:O-methyltransferase